MDSMQGSFSFKNDNVYFCVLEPSIHLHITRSADGDTAFISFVRPATDTAPETPIPIPANISLRNELRGADVPPRHDEFTITWTSSYVLMRHGIELFRLNAQRQHSMRAPTPLPYGTIKKRKMAEAMVDEPKADSAAEHQNP